MKADRENARRVVDWAKGAGIFVFLEDGKLKYKISRGLQPDPAIIAELRDNKKAVIHFLRTEDQYDAANDITICPRDNDGKACLSFSQERLWLIDKLHGSVNYHMPVLFRIKGDLDREALERAIKEILGRHRALRTIIGEEEGVPYQSIQPAGGWELRYTDWIVMGEQDLGVHLEEICHRPFDLSTDYMIRAELIKMADEEYVMMVVIHHIASDGWSMSLLVRELTLLYRAYSSGGIADLQVPAIQYTDYALWQRRYMTGTRLEDQLKYWNGKLAGLEPLALPTDYRRTAVQSMQGRRMMFSLEKELHASLQGLSNEEGVTLFMTLLTIFKILLWRYSGQDDICVGVPVANRRQQETETTVGFFVNTLALRTGLEGNPTLKELLQRVKATTLESFNHQDVPFEKVVENLGVGRDLSRTPVFQVMFSLQSERELTELRLTGTVFSIEKYDHHTSKFDLSFDMREGENGGLVVAVEYCTDLFEESTIRRMSAHYSRLLESAMLNSNGRISELHMLSGEEEEEVLYGFNRTEMGHPEGQTIVSLFEEQVDRSPDAVAIEMEGQRINYLELNERSNRLAHYLIGRGFTGEFLIPVCLERSVEMLVAILGILKAGGAYVPLDPEYPTDRLNYMLEDVGASIVVTDRMLNCGEGREVINLLLYELRWERDGEGHDNPGLNIPAKRLCYVIYTSGTTGKPKGVMNEHRGLINRIRWAQGTFRLDQRDAVLQKTTYCFDVSVWELLWPLLMGARVVFARPGWQGDATYLRETIRRHHISTIHFVPSMLEAFLEGLDDGGDLGLRRVLCSGEALKPEQVILFRKKLGQTDLYNLYGPTEASIDVSYWKVPLGQLQEGRVLIGRPVWNTQLYILDQWGIAVPVGVWGELYIGGVQVARGYLNNPMLTAEKFMPDRLGDQEGAKLYRTGDACKWLPDGNIVYGGRLDQQIKIHGYRIEPAEIEQVLKEHQYISDAIVVARQAGGEQLLVAYVVAGKPVPAAELKKYLLSKLPSYMVPVHYVELESLPLTDSGKTDRKTLPAPPGMSEEKEYDVPVTETEQRLAEIWVGLLGSRQTGAASAFRVGRKANFFALGGHSLDVTRLVSRICREWEVKVDIKEIFSHASLEEQAELISGAMRTRLVKIDPVEISDRYPLSSSQRRLWIISQFKDGNIAYNMPGVYRLAGALDRTRLTLAFQQLIGRHEILRTIFKEDDEADLCQWVLPLSTARDFAIPYEDLMEQEDSNIRATEIIREEIIRPFDLASGPLLRARLLRTEEDKYILSCVVHHTISDGWSLDILIRELMLLYNGNKEGITYRLPPLRIHYKDYAVWQQTQLREGRLLGQRAYWLRQLEGDLPVLELPLDRPRPPLKSYRGGVVKKRIHSEFLQRFVRLCRQEDCTLFMGLLGLVNTLLYRYTGQEDIIVGSPVAGREQMELEDQIGMYVNTLAIRTSLSGKESYRELLRRIRSVTLNAYLHQAYPFDDLVDELKLERDLSRSALFDVMVVLQNTYSESQLRLEKGLQAVQVEKNEGIEALFSQFDLTFTFQEKEGDLRMIIEYCSALFDKGTIERIASHLEEIMKAVVGHPELPIGQLEYLCTDERDHLLALAGHSQVREEDNATLIDLFEAQVKVKPDKVAVVFKDRELTYAGLNEWADDLASYLISQYHVGPNDTVGIQVERSEWMIICLLAVLKSGGAYVPIDPECPQQRVSFIMEDCHCKVMLNEEELDKFRRDRSDNCGPRTNRPEAPDDLAYIIYTSGSSGRPKGVMIERRSLWGYCRFFKDYFSLTAGDRVIQQSSLSFDTHVEEIFPTLISGGLLLISQHGSRELSELQDLIHHGKASLLSTTPLVIGELHASGIDLFPLRVLISGGDVLNYAGVSRYAGKIGLFNTYGPSEATVCCCFYSIGNERGRSVPAGRPIAGARVYVLDAGEKLLPVGVFGEIHIAGAGLARGYLNDPTLTENKFVKDLYGKGTMYKTGDIGRWLPDGNLEISGRADSQVKIRGHRTEPGEIEKNILLYPPVDQVVVIPYPEKSGASSIMAFFMAKKAVEPADLRRFLTELLPSYMIPASFTQLEQFPRTASGKIDKKSLQRDKKYHYTVESSFVKPGNDTQRRVRKIWCDVLLLPPEDIGIDNNFFDLGGNSFKIMRMRKLINREFEKNISVPLLFTLPTIREFCEYLTSNGMADGQNDENGSEEVVGFMLQTFSTINQSIGGDEA